MDQYLVGAFTVLLGGYLYHLLTVQRALKDKKLETLQNLQMLFKILTEYATILTQEHYQCNYFRKANELKPNDDKIWNALLRATNEVSNLTSKMIEQKAELSKNLFLYKKYFGKSDGLFELIAKINWNDIDKFEFKQQIVNIPTLNRIHNENLQNVFKLMEETVGSKVKVIEGHLEQKALEV